MGYSDSTFSDVSNDRPQRSTHGGAGRAVVPGRGEARAAALEAGSPAAANVCAGIIGVDRDRVVVECVELRFVDPVHVGVGPGPADKTRGMGGKQNEKKKKNKKKGKKESGA